MSDTDQAGEDEVVQPKPTTPPDEPVPPLANVPKGYRVHKENPVQNPLRVPTGN